MKKLLFLQFVLLSTTLLAQVPEDALRYSWYPQNGSARNMAVGGVMGSLGGDISAAFVNPAGLGLFRTREFVFSPSFKKATNSVGYRDNNDNHTTKNKIAIGPIGFILGFPGVTDINRSSAFCFAVNQIADFSNNIHYKALNNYSSFSEQFAEEFAKSGLSIDQALNSNSTVPYTVAPALYTYLIDTVNINGTLQVKGAPEFLLDSGLSLMQEKQKTTKGGMNEIALSIGSNVNEKWLVGFTLGIPIINYQSHTIFSEKDISGDTTNRFNAFTYVDDFTTKGSGVNGKFGIIYRPKEYIRLGFALHTPSLLMLTDTRSTSLQTELENPVNTYSVSSTTFTNNQAGESKYGLNTPWKAMISGSYVFRELEDVRKQRGFISADIEYLRHKASRFNSQNESPTPDEKAYYKSLNQVIKNEYKSTFNFRVGGELKYDVFMGRLGFAYYSNPYMDKAFSANQMFLSGGLGYRNNGFFIDLTYVYGIKKDIDLPYRLEDRANTFATLKQNQQNIYATLGIKF
jgi:hypothetical protein